MKKLKHYDYYLHRSGGRAFDYFGGVGKPYRVNIFHAYLFKLLGYCMTRVQRGSDIRRVMTRAILQRGAHRHSYAMEHDRENYGDNYGR